MLNIELHVVEIKCLKLNVKYWSTCSWN